MTCSLCLSQTPELQTIGDDGKCPRCATDYSAWTHLSVSRVVLPDLSGNGWKHTHKLIPTGRGYADRLLAARIALRSYHE